MKKWLLIIFACILLMASAFAEETLQNVVIYFQDGGMALLPAEIGNDAEALAAYCAQYFPGRMYTTDGDSAALDYDATLSEEWTKAHYGENSRAMLVRLVKLGLTQTTVITAQGDEVTVPSHCLKFADGVDAQHLLGFVYAPRTGEATIREKEGGSAKTIGKGKTGKVVAILEYDGGNFTKIRYDDIEGYIRTDCLIFHDGKEGALWTGILHINGVKDGSKTVTIRADKSTSKAKVAAWETGTSVIVHAEDKGWYTVEKDGWVGYVQSQYLTLIQD